MSAQPQTMRAILLERHHADPYEAIASLKRVTRPVPVPGPGEVLVRVEAAPCNPSDLMFLLGRYGITKTLPTVPGFECAGTVIASGGGMMGRFLLGQRVACAGQGDSDGTWAEYFVAGVNFCIPLKKAVSFEQGAMLLVNPLTALSLFDKCKREGHLAAVHTAGASALGRMLIRLAERENYPLINLVRREEQKREIEALGAQHVLVTSAPDFEQKLKERTYTLGATIALEAVAGVMTGQVLRGMPDQAKAVVYGGLSGEDCGGVDPIGLIFRSQSVEGFWLTTELANKSLLAKMSLSNRAQALIADEVFGSTVRARLSLEQVQEGLADYQRNMSLGKVLISPQLPLIAR